VAERKDKDPVFGRLDDLDDVPSLPLGLRNSGPVPRGDEADLNARPSQEPRGPGRREDSVEPGPAISVVSSLTNRTQSAPVEFDESAPGHPGAAMRFARERLGLDTADLAARTRLSRRIIEDLESNRFDSMPPAYVRGYLRAVARELEGDADSWIRAYEGMGFSEPVLKATVQQTSTRWGLSRGIWGLMVGAILASALGLGVYSWTEGDGANPMAGLTGWFSDTAQRFKRAAPEPDPASFPASESAEEILWVPGPEAAEELQWLPREGPAGPPGEALELDIEAAVEPEALRPEPELPALPAEPAVVVAEPDPAPAQPESVAAEPARPSAATAAPGSRLTEAPVAPPEVTTEPEVTAEPELPAALEAPSVAAVPVPVPRPIETATGERAALSLAFEGTSWIEVRSASDRVALRGIFHAGDERSVVVEMPARVILGNAPAVRLSRDGRPVALEAHTREDRTARFSLGAD
jgi:cytoskeleton protein RodZ